MILLPRLVGPGSGALIGSRAEPFVAWAAVTALVCVGEEVLLRGVLFEAAGELAGPAAAVCLTSLAFALLHVPTYGWAVLPVDLAAGIWLAGLRMVSGGVTAPTVTHLLADLTTW